MCFTLVSLESTSCFSPTTLYKSLYLWLWSSFPWLFISFHKPTTLIIHKSLSSVNGADLLGIRNRTCNVVPVFYVIYVILWLYFSDKEAFGGLLLFPPCDVTWCDEIPHSFIPGSQILSTIDLSLSQDWHHGFLAVYGLFLAYPIFLAHSVCHC